MANEPIYGLRFTMAAATHEKNNDLIWMSTRGLSQVSVRLGCGCFLVVLPVGQYLA
jgi:hypothetical protein